MKKQNIILSIEIFFLCYKIITRQNINKINVCLYIDYDQLSFFLLILLTNFAISKLSDDSFTKSMLYAENLMNVTSEEYVLIAKHCPSCQSLVMARLEKESNG